MMDGTGRSSLGFWCRKHMHSIAGCDGCAGDHSGSVEDCMTRNRTTPAWLCMVAGCDEIPTHRIYWNGSPATSDVCAHTAKRFRSRVLVVPIRRSKKLWRQFKRARRLLSPYARTKMLAGSKACSWCGEALRFDVCNNDHCGYKMTEEYAGPSSARRKGSHENEEGGDRAAVRARAEEESRAAMTMHERTSEIAEQIAIAQIRKGVVKGTPLEERLRAAMREAATHWCLEEAHANLGVRLRAAVTAVLAESDDDEEKQRTISSHRQLAMLGAYIEALTKGLRVEPPEIEDIEGGPVPLMALWREVTGEKGHP